MTRSTIAKLCPSSVSRRSHKAAADLTLYFLNQAIQYMVLHNVQTCAFNLFMCLVWVSFVRSFICLFTGVYIRWTVRRLIFTLWVDDRFNRSVQLIGSFDQFVRSVDRFVRLVRSISSFDGFVRWVRSMGSFDGFC
jgi:hypothetical protein